jgi:hypothetical protein
VSASGVCVVFARALLETTRIEGEERVTACCKSGRGFWFVAPCLICQLGDTNQGVKLTVRIICVILDLQLRLYVHVSSTDS